MWSVHLISPCVSCYYRNSNNRMSSYMCEVVISCLVAWQLRRFWPRSLTVKQWTAGPSVSSRTYCKYDIWAISWVSAQNRTTVWHCRWTTLYYSVDYILCHPEGFYSSATSAVFQWRLTCWSVYNSMEWCPKSAMIQVFIMHILCFLFFFLCVCVLKNTLHALFLSRSLSL